MEKEKNLELPWWVGWSGGVFIGGRTNMLGFPSVSVTSDVSDIYNTCNTISYV